MRRQEGREGQQSAIPVQKCQKVVPHVQLHWNAAQHVRRSLMRVQHYCHGSAFHPIPDTGEKRGRAFRHAACAPDCVLCHNSDEAGRGKELGIGRLGVVQDSLKPGHSVSAICALQHASQTAQGRRPRLGYLPCNKLCTLWTVQIP